MGDGRLGVDEPGLAEFVRRVHGRWPLERAVLFGSRARGDELRESDYDLILVSLAFEGIRFTERMMLVRDLWPLAERLEVLCYTPAEFERKRSEIGIVAEGLREGRELPIP
jgi:predicted nucleotidyltransferase